MRTLASELGSHVERLTARPRIYADADMPAGVVAHMRNRLGWDVFSVIEDDALRRATDEEHYRLARKLRRMLISLDRDYFDERRFPMAESGGVIVLSAPDERGLARVLTKVNRAFFSRRTATKHARTTAPPLVGQKIHAHPGLSAPRDDEAP